MITIEQELANLTNNFSDKNPAVRCRTMEEKQEALRIFRNHYKNVEAMDRRLPGEKEMNWVISCSNPIPSSISESIINEEDEDFEDFDYDNIDLSEFDNPEDDLDMEEENYDTIDDASEVDEANRITLLKKKAADLSKKWMETYKEITKLATKLDLTATYDDDFNIELKKTNGEPSDIEGDLDEIKSDLDSAIEDSEEVDDSFGPSEYDSRAAYFQDEPNAVYEESLNTKTITESSYPWNKNNGTLNLNPDTSIISDPNELPIREDEIDDDF